MLGYKKAKWDEISDPADMMKPYKELMEEKEALDDLDDPLDGGECETLRWFDCMGDVKAKLKNNGLKHVVHKNPQIEDAARVFDVTFKKFEEELKSDYEEKYPRYRRFNAFLDRRPDDDELIMYEPPDHCKFIPHNHLPLWFLSASRSCLIPNMKYNGDAREAANAVHLRVLEKQKQIDQSKGYEFTFRFAKCIKKTPVKNGMDFELIVKITIGRYAKIWVHRTDEPISYELVKGPIPVKFRRQDEDTPARRYKTIQEMLQNTNVHSASHVKGGMIVMSFHALAADEIKCYFYHSGAICRFMPEDIMEIFPKYFDPTWDHGRNRKYWESGKAKQYYEQIKGKLPDVSFESFAHQFQSDYDPNKPPSKEELDEIEKQKNILGF